MIADAVIGAIRRRLSELERKALAAIADLTTLDTRIDDIDAAWTSFTPAIVGSTTNPSMGTGGTTAGAYKQIGNTVLWRAVFVSGSSGYSSGSGDYSVAPPTDVQGTFPIVGHGWAYNGSFLALVADGATGRLIKADGGVTLSSTDGVFGGSSHVLSLSGSYEVN